MGTSFSIEFVICATTADSNGGNRTAPKSILAVSGSPIGKSIGINVASQLSMPATSQLIFRYGLSPLALHVINAHKKLDTRH